MPKHWLKVLGIILGLFILGVYIASCPNPIRYFYLRKQLESNQKLWQSKNISYYHYQIEYMWLGYRWIEKIQVKNGVVISETFNEPTKGATRLEFFDNYNTMDKIFTSVHSSLQKHGVLEQIEVTYDKNLDYPLIIKDSDLNPIVRDAISIITISDFQVLN